LLLISFDLSYQSFLRKVLSVARLAIDRGSRGRLIAGLPIAGTRPPGSPVTGRTLLTEADSEITIVLPAGHSESGR
jgi:hypothetical protein